MYLPPTLRNRSYTHKHTHTYNWSPIYTLMLPDTSPSPLTQVQQLSSICLSFTCISLYFHSICIYPHILYGYFASFQTFNKLCHTLYILLKFFEHNILFLKLFSVSTLLTLCFHSYRITFCYQTTTYSTIFLVKNFW